MGLIITSSILIILSFLLLGICINFQDETATWRFNKKMLLAPLWLLIILFGCFTNVEANTVGIVYNPFAGGIQSRTLTEGYKTKSPFTKVYKISTKVETMNFQNLNVQSQVNSIH